MELLEEMLDLVEIHPRSNLNFCLFGGMHELMSLIFSHPSEAVRKLSCSIFASITQNNSEVQEFATKCGAMNLVVQLERESAIASKEAVLSCLRTFIGGSNFNGKRIFIEQFRGLDVLANMICADSASEVKKSMRLQKKVLMLLHDLALNDDNIIPGNSQYTRRSIGSSDVLVKALLTDLEQS
jgi:hypothetical protein